MKRIMSVAVLVAAASFVLTQPARGGAGPEANGEQAVRQVLNELYAALGRNDAGSLDRIYSDDYTLINESGLLTTKAPRLAAIRSGELKFESAGYDEANIRLYGNTAVATYRVMLKGQFKGQDVGGQLRVTSTLVKTKGRWQLVATQATSIATQ
jgi:ketosteroid isomerase-like protein